MTDLEARVRAEVAEFKRTRRLPRTLRLRMASGIGTEFLDEDEVYQAISDACRDLSEADDLLVGGWDTEPEYDLDEPPTEQAESEQDPGKSETEQEAEAGARIHASLQIALDAATAERDAHEAAMLVCRLIDQHRLRLFSPRALGELIERALQMKEEAPRCVRNKHRSPCRRCRRPQDKGTHVWWTPGHGIECWYCYERRL